VQSSVQEPEPQVTDEPQLLRPVQRMLHVGLEQETELAQLKSAEQSTLHELDAAQSMLELQASAPVHSMMQSPLPQVIGLWQESSPAHCTVQSLASEQSTSSWHAFVSDGSSPHSTVQSPVPQRTSLWQSPASVQSTSQGMPSAHSSGHRGSTSTT
jgi:hypothetical protein